MARHGIGGLCGAPVFTPHGSIAEDGDENSAYDRTRLKASLFSGFGVVPVSQGYAARRFVREPVERGYQRFESPAILARVAVHTSQSSLV